MPVTSCVSLGHTFNLFGLQFWLVFLICKMMLFESHGLLNSSEFQPPVIP